MMAFAAETAVSQRGGDGSQPGTQDLLALANAAAAGEKPPARPRRGKLMRYLSHDGGSADSRANGGSGSSTPSRGRLTRMTSLQLQDEAGIGQPQAGTGAGIVLRATRKKMSFRRSNSHSAADFKKREQGARIAGGKNPSDIGIRPPEEISGKPAPRRTTTSTTAATTVAAAAVPNTAATAATPRRRAPPMTASSPRVRASQMGEMFDSSSYAGDDPARPGHARGGSSRGNDIALDNSGGDGGDGHAKLAGHRKSKSTHCPTSTSSGGVTVTKGSAPTPPPMPATIVLPSNDVSLGLPHSNISPLLKADRGVFPFVAVRGPVRGEEEAAQASAGAEAVVRDCLYNSHGMVALDGYLWKPGSIRLLRRWMMLVDNTLYYFVKPG